MVKSFFFKFILSFTLALGVIEIGLRVIGHVDVTKIRQDLSIDPEQEMRILCLGDSTTYFGGDDSYPSQLQRLLQKRYPDSKIKVINHGVPGTNTNVIAEKIETILDQYKPNLVITMLGISDDMIFPAIIYDDSIKAKFSNFIQGFKLFKFLGLTSLHIRERVGKSEFFKTLGHQLNLVSIEKKRQLLENKIQSEGRETDYLELANLVFESGLVEDAEKVLMQALAKYPQSPLLFSELGKFYFKIGELNKAKELYEKSSLLDSKASGPYFNLGELYFSLSEYLLAEENYLKAFIQDPNSFESLYPLTEVYKVIGDFERNEKNLKGLCTKYKTGAAFLALGWFYVNSQRYDLAQNSFLQGIERWPDNYFFHYSLGWMFHVQGDFKKAVRWYQKSSELAQGRDQGVSHLGLGLAFKDLRNNEMAKHHLEKAMQVSDYFQQGFKQLLSIHYDNVGELSKSRKLHREVLNKRTNKLNPITVYNYRSIVNKILQRKIPVIAMQYPNRQLSLLKDMLPHHPLLNLLGNEDNFREALNTHSFYELFVDNFDGDIGHLAPKGHELIAKNLETFIQQQFNLTGLSL